jgi:hypothetical protein
VRRVSQLHQTQHNHERISDSRRFLGHVEQTVDSVHGPIDRNRVLLSANFLFDSFRNLIVERSLYSFVWISEIEPGFNPCWRVSKVILFIFHRQFKQSMRKSHSFGSLIAVQRVRKAT